MKIYFKSSDVERWQGRRGAWTAAAILRPLLSAGSRLWGWGQQLRGAAWEHLPRHWPPVPVVSVGSLTAGGVGKTEVAAWLAAALSARGARVAILSRGYGGSGRSWPHEVRPEDPPQVWGDEPVLLARRLPQVKVVVDPRRVRSAKVLVDQGVDALILDDGFQHLPLGRHLEVVVVGTHRPPWGDALLPLGTLRSPLEALRRADLVWIHGDGALEATGALPQRPAVYSRLRVTAVVASGGGGAIPPGPVGVLTSMASPWRVLRALEAEGYRVVAHHELGDHAPISARCLTAAAAAALRAGAGALVCSPREEVKLPAVALPLPLGVAQTRMEVEAPEAALASALAALRENFFALNPGVRVQWLNAT